MNTRSLVSALAKITPRLAGRVAVLLALTALCFSQSIPVQPGYPSNQAGRVQASAYANWQTTAVNAVAAGSGSMTLGSCTFPVGSNNRFAPFGSIIALNVPIQVFDGANSEVVTPTAVTTPTAAGPSAINPLNCSFTATFANAHSVNVRLGSGDNGLMEAVNDAAALGAAYVTVDNYSGISTQAILNATTTVAGGIIPNIIIEYTKSGTPGAIIPGTVFNSVTGSESTNTVTLTTASGNWSASYAGGNLVYVSNCSIAGYNGLFALASGGSGGTTLTYLDNTASMGAATGCTVQAASPNGLNQPLYFALRPTTLTLISAPAAPTITSVTGSLTSGAYRAMSAYVDCLGGVSLASTDSTQSGTITGMSLSSPAATAGACGWLPYITANGGSAGTEILAKQTIDANICPLSTLETVIPACAIGSPAVITAGNPSSTSKPVVEGTAHTTFAYQPFTSPPLNFQTSYGPFVAASTINNSNADLAQAYIPAQFFNTLGKAWNICFKGATATQVASSVLAYSLQMSNNYAQSPVSVSTVTLGTYTQGAAGTQYGCWKISVAATGTSGTFWAGTPAPFYNVLNSAVTTFTGAAEDVSTAASSTIDLSKGIWLSVNLAGTGSANITGPIINQFTIEPVAAN